jgi:AcrR family transcriptional regulator
MATMPHRDDPKTPQWSPRERELLTVTFELLQKVGYDRLTVDAVVAAAKASKTTVYRRWPSKAELVVAACVQGFQHAMIAPDTGTLRGDLIRIGEMALERLVHGSGTLAAVVPELSRSAELNAVVRRELVDRQEAVMRAVFQRAAARGEINAEAITSEMWDVLSGYLLMRFLVPVRSRPTNRTVQNLVDDVMLPSLRRIPPSASNRTTTNTNEIMENS